MRQVANIGKATKARGHRKAHGFQDRIQRHASFDDFGFTDDILKRVPINVLSTTVTKTNER